MKHLKNFLIFLMIPVVAGCSSRGLTTEDRPSKEYHQHRYDKVTGICECGKSLAYNLGGDAVNDTVYNFKPDKGMIYFNFKSACTSSFLISDSYHTFKYYGSNYKELIKEIKLYAQDGNDPKLFKSLNIEKTLQIVNNWKYTEYKSVNELECDTHYYFVVSLKDEVKNFNLNLNAFTPHSYVEEPTWIDNEDRSKRVATFTCEHCGRECKHEEIYLLDVTLPEILAMRGKPIGEFKKELNKQLDIETVKSHYYFNMIAFDINSEFKPVSYTEAHAATVELTPRVGYCFDPSRTIVKDSLNNRIEDACIEYKKAVLNFVVTQNYTGK